jgi:uncharacterized protein with GYD domain
VALARQPEDRSEAVGELIESLSARLISFYYSFGNYDGLLISEAPEETAIASALVAAVSAGHINTIKTTTLLSAEDGIKVLRRAGEITYRDKELGSSWPRRLRRDEVSSPAPFAYATPLRFSRRSPVGSWVNKGGRVACRYTKILNRSLRTIRGRGVGPGQGGKACEAGPLL